MSIYQRPETYVEQFIESVLNSVKGTKYEKMGFPHIRLTPDYGIENIAIEAEPPCNRARGKKQIKDYMKNYNKPFGILIDIPVERYYQEYPKPCRDKVGFELYTWFGDKIDTIYVREFDVEGGKEKEIIDRAAEELKSIIDLLIGLSKGLQVARIRPTPEFLIAEVNEITRKHLQTLKSIISSTKRASTYFNIWKNTMELIYGKEVVRIEEIDDLFIKLTIYVTWLKCLGSTLLEAALGGGRYSIPIKLYLDGYKAAMELFWHRKALARFNIDYLFERDEYDWVFDPNIAPQLDEFFRDIGRSLLSVDWGQGAELDLLKRVYQNIVRREVRRQLGEFYTPDWIAQIILWRALYMLVKGTPPQQDIVPDPIDKVVELIDEFYSKHPGMIPRFIDPTCGSFTFGVHYINSLLEWYAKKKPQINPVNFAMLIVNNVVGIDLNPVAVIMAKVNYLLQIYRLLTVRGDFLVAQPIIPILRLDLLFIHASEEGRKYETLDAYFIGREGNTAILRIPLEPLVMNVSEDLTSRLRRKGINVKEIKVKGEEESIHYIEAALPLSIVNKAKDIVVLMRAFIALLNNGVKGFEHEVGKLDEDERKSLEEFRNMILALDSMGLNSVWHSIVLNLMLALHIVQQKFDLVLGNLPWVNVSKYPKGYTGFVKSVAKDLNVLPPGQVAKKLDISIPLFAVALKHLASSPSITALMVPCSILRGSHGAEWRRYISSPPYTLIEVWDLQDVKPFEGAENQPGIVFVLRR